MRAVPDRSSQDAPPGAATADEPTAPRGASSTTITLCPDGPLLVRGDVELFDADGERVEPRRSTVALCRCGASAIKPFCDGTHKVNGFRSDV
ncbi:CDGSH iron-sulfur domain-containing protein [Sanguibacter sp. YZGR15]|uniref:CDGSH iron-sulfur domain-containing protein n=1 Tax=Sanguibacter suaedae TaxID=2795737 RepID=A0A934IA53_9MICO|nr:CDGSH iron-sulfur domain-containing protein [Sanguibacter suaedae]